MPNAHRWGFVLFFALLAGSLEAGAWDYQFSSDFKFEYMPDLVPGTLDQYKAIDYPNVKLLIGRFDDRDMRTELDKMSDEDIKSTLLKKAVETDIIEEKTGRKIVDFKVSRLASYVTVYNKFQMKKEGKAFTEIEIAVASKTRAAFATLSIDGDLKGSVEEALTKAVKDFQIVESSGAALQGPSGDRRSISLYNLMKIVGVAFEDEAHAEPAASSCDPKYMKKYVADGDYSADVPGSALFKFVHLTNDVIGSTAEGHDAHDRECLVDTYNKAKKNAVDYWANHGVGGGCLDDKGDDTHKDSTLCNDMRASFTFIDNLDKRLAQHLESPPQAEPQACCQQAASMQQRLLAARATADVVHDSFCCQQSDNVQDKGPLMLALESENAFWWGSQDFKNKSPQAKREACSAMMTNKGPDNALVNGAFQLGGCAYNIVNALSRSLKSLVKGLRSLFDRNTLKFVGGLLSGSGPAWTKAYDMFQTIGQEIGAKLYSVNECLSPYEKHQYWCKLAAEFVGAFIAAPAMLSKLISWIATGSKMAAVVAVSQWGAKPPLKQVLELGYKTARVVDKGTKPIRALPPVRYSLTALKAVKKVLFYDIGTPFKTLVKNAVVKAGRGAANLGSNIQSGARALLVSRQLSKPVENTAFTSTATLNPPTKVIAGEGAGTTGAGGTGSGAGSSGTGSANAGGSGTTASASSKGVPDQGVADPKQVQKIEKQIATGTSTPTSLQARVETLKASNVKLTSQLTSGPLKQSRKVGYRRQMQNNLDEIAAIEEASRKAGGVTQPSQPAQVAFDNKSVPSKGIPDLKQVEKIETKIADGTTNRSALDDRVEKLKKDNVVLELKLRAGGNFSKAETAVIQKTMQKNLDEISSIDVAMGKAERPVSTAPDGASAPTNTTANDFIPKSGQANPDQVMRLEKKISDGKVSRSALEDRIEALNKENADLTQQLSSGQDMSVGLKEAKRRALQNNLNEVANTDSALGRLGRRNKPLADPPAQNAVTPNNDMVLEYRRALAKNGEQYAETIEKDLARQLNTQQKALNKMQTEGGAGRNQLAKAQKALDETRTRIASFEKVKREFREKRWQDNPTTANSVPDSQPGVAPDAKVVQRYTNQLERKGPEYARVLRKDLNTRLARQQESLDKLNNAKMKSPADIRRAQQAVDSTKTNLSSLDQAERNVKVGADKSQEAVTQAPPAKPVDPAPVAANPQVATRQGGKAVEPLKPTRRNIRNAEKSKVALEQEIQSLQSKLASNPPHAEEVRSLINQRKEQLAQVESDLEGMRRIKPPSALGNAWDSIKQRFQRKPPPTRAEPTMNEPVNVPAAEERLSLAEKDLENIDREANGRNTPQIHNQLNEQEGVIFRSEDTALKARVDQAKQMAVKAGQTLKSGAAKVRNKLSRNQGASEATTSTSGGEVTPGQTSELQGMAYDIRFSETRISNAKYEIEALKGNAELYKKYHGEDDFLARQNQHISEREAALHQMEDDLAAKQSSYNQAFNNAPKDVQANVSEFDHVWRARMAQRNADAAANRAKFWDEEGKKSDHMDTKDYQWQFHDHNINSSAARAKQLRAEADALNAPDKAAVSSADAQVQAAWDELDQMARKEPNPGTPEFHQQVSQKEGIVFKAEETALKVHLDRASQAVNKATQSVRATANKIKTRWQNRSGAKSANPGGELQPNELRYLVEDIRQSERMIEYQRHEIDVMRREADLWGDLQKNGNLEKLNQQEEALRRAEEQLATDKRILQKNYEEASPELQSELEQLDHAAQSRFAAESARVAEDALKETLREAKLTQNRPPDDIMRRWDELKVQAAQERVNQIQSDIGLMKRRPAAAEIKSAESQVKAMEQDLDRLRKIRATSAGEAPEANRLLDQSIEAQARELKKAQSDLGVMKGNLSSNPRAPAKVPRADIKAAKANVRDLEEQVSRLQALQRHYDAHELPNQVWTQLKHKQNELEHARELVNRMNANSSRVPVLIPVDQSGEQTLDGLGQPAQP